MCGPVGVRREGRWVGGWRESSVNVRKVVGWLEGRRMMKEGRRLGEVVTE